MRLKKIRLAGFKSFVDPINIPFPDDMTAIVGPNGCGKSNVIDAVRWVLGESSAKNLRGDAMIDVIFNGSSARKPVSQCSVELVFDNSSGRIQGEYANYNELSVKRLVTRDGQSTYFLNNAKCRRRDVTDIFLGTGLGPRSYAIIEQGMISRLIESKPQELRVFIEEAAGISKYKERRRETENRIRHTRENLDRLNDVRGELGQQLEKLQRQATAAKKFKELKAKERQYKGELAAVKWLKHTEHIQELESQIAKQEAEIESFIAQQRGDETEITTFKEQQAELKQKATDIQQQYFKLGNEITRLEQSQIHAKQRRQQIEQEIHSIDDSIASTSQQTSSHLAQIEEVQQSLDEIGPSQELLEEQLLQAEEQLSESEDTFNEKQQHWREEEQRFNSLKHQVQSKHGQIQSGMQMQMRTEERLKELRAESVHLGNDQLSEELQNLAEQLVIATENLEITLEKLEEAGLQVATEQNRYDGLNQDNVDLQQEQQQLLAKLTSLETLQNEQQGQSEVIEQWLRECGQSGDNIWQYLDAEEGWETALETALQQWNGSQVLDQPSALEPVQGLKLFFTSQMTHHKPENSLAAKCRAEKVPEWLAWIEIANSEQAALDRRPSLDSGASVITQTGLWIGSDWSIYGVESANSGSLARLNEIKTTNELVAKVSEQKDRVAEELEQAKASLVEVGAVERQLKDQKQQLVIEQAQLEKQKSFIEQQQAKQEEQRRKIEHDITYQSEQLQEEVAQLEELAAEIEELEAKLTDGQNFYENMERERLDFQNQIVTRRQQVEQSKNEKHNLALQVQSLQHQLQTVKDAQQRATELSEQMLEKRAQLLAETEELAMPLEEQAEKLEMLLAQRVVCEEEQESCLDALAEVENKLSEIEKGQHGIQSKIEQMREVQQSAKLECEGFKVRANSVLDQLKEMQQSLKEILETLPEDAEESVWQQELDKIGNSLSRLGAVNLAAVEEYEVQSERKQHLDEQNEDLVEALETLENAIRKIDRETRARFRDTFDKVNADLKMLFPKVFGGGAAYLELTDDDLLDTGVTIMARPPGKKNSTIHLLSGGEKALTALSLVFAIFRLNPAPFCLLDEVDAPLDDANVGRFCKLVSEMSKSVQFIYITHNKIAMEMALHLTGVTMAEPGVSRVVAVDVEEAVAIANA